MNGEMQYKQRKILVVVQVIAVIIGLILAVIDFPYPTVRELLDEFLILPIALAGLLRFGVRAYQITSVKLGRKVYDEVGNCLTVSRTGLGIVIGIACPFVLVGVITMLPDISRILLYIVYIVLLVIAVLLFIMDVKYLKTGKQS